MELLRNCLYACGFGLSWLCFTLVYRLLFHPLSKYPGPTLAKVTNAYNAYFAACRKLHLVTQRNVLRYGDVVRYGPDRLLFNTASAYRDIFLNPQINKADIYRLTQFNPQKNIFGTLEREQHRQKRKTYGQVLSDKSLRIIEPMMIREIDVFLRLIEASKTASLDMSPLCSRLTADIAGQMAFGQELNTQTSTEYRTLPQSLKTGNAVANLFMVWPKLSYVWPLLRLLIRKNGRVLVQTVQQIVAARMTRSKDVVHDFYSVATADADLEHDRLRETQIWAEAVFILPAAGSTLSVAASAFFFYLSRSTNSEAYNRLAAEIRESFVSGKEINSRNLQSCEFLQAVIDETLRMAPPFLGTLWRQPYASHAGRFVVDGHVIPRGVMVGVNPYALMHNETYFPDPFTFKPERWLAGENPSLEERRRIDEARSAFMPFAQGETSCLGKAMVYQEMSLVIAKTLWYFDFAPTPGEEGRLGEGQVGKTDGRDRPDEYQLYDMAVADHYGPNLVFTPRGEHWKELTAVH